MGIHSFVSGGENVALIAIQILGISVLAGLVGAVLGLGGGIIVTPALTLLFGVDIKHAIGASIISVIATSSGSAIAYIRDRIAGQLVHLVRRRASSEAFEGGHFPNFCTVSGYCFEGVTPAPVVCRLFADCPPRIHAGCDFRFKGRIRHTAAGHTPSLSLLPGRRVHWARGMYRLRSRRRTDRR